MGAKTTKSFFSRETEVAIDIRARAEDVWSTLTNAADYPKWNSTVVSLQGQIATGNKIELKSTLDPKRAFKLKVLEMDPRMIPPFDEVFDRFAADLKKKVEGGTP